MQGDVDGWMPKHFDDSLWHPAMSSAANYAVQCDWDRLPSVYNDDCTRFIPYVTTEIAGLLTWLDVPEALEAIEDGAEREGQYPALDGEPFNGTILDVVSVHGAGGSDIAGKGPILAERFHVGDADVTEFDEWLHGPYLERAALWPGVVRVRTFAATPGIPQRF